MTRAERAALTRRELLAAAERRFLSDGYHATSLDQIALDAGYTKGAVYSTFDSKAGLFLALMDEVMERRLQALRDLLEGPTGPELLELVARRQIDPHEDAFLLVAIEFIVHAAREESLLAEVSERYRGLRARLAELAPSASPLGADRWALATLALSNGLAVERMIDPGGVPGDMMSAVQALIVV